jgi:hypothetical protein
MPSIEDLSDERRPAKKWLPASDRDVSEGRVIMDRHGKPECVEHGAMNRIDPNERLYRCMHIWCGVGARLVLDAATDAA